MNKGLLLFLFLSILSIQSFGQNTVGLISYDFDKVQEGYNLLYPHNQPNVYLLNNCGEIVHTWEGTENFRPGNTAYIMPDGRLIKTSRPADISGDPLWAGGGGAHIEIRSWDNELLWFFEQNDASARLHHDIAPLENGNILAISWEVKSEQEAIQAGRDPESLDFSDLWPDYIFEIKPLEDNNYEIVWEWHAWDHLIQDFDAQKDNFGSVVDNPGRIDINYTYSNAADWLHMNAIDYNPILDQIVLSVPTFGEVWIIDHSTTTAQAASSSGGLSGKGGDILYRYGNPQAYKAGTEADRVFFYQHDAHWNDDFITPSNPFFGKISVFNNRVAPNTSTVNIFNPVFDSYEWEYPMDGNTWGPDNFDWSYIHPDTFPMQSNILSSIQTLDNGNVLICVGRNGYNFEITPDEEIVWEYETPMDGQSYATQGDTLVISDNFTFQIRRYPLDYEPFLDKDLSPKGFIELEPNTDFCQITSTSEENIQVSKVQIAPNPANALIQIDLEGPSNQKAVIYNMHGQVMERLNLQSGTQVLDISHLPPGTYWLKTEENEAQLFLKI